MQVYTLLADMQLRKVWWYICANEYSQQTKTASYFHLAQVSSRRASVWACDLPLPACRLADIKLSCSSPHPLNP